MKKTLAAAFLLSAFAAAANANTGIFFGSGHTITFGKSEQVQLVSEEVTIKPNCGWHLMADSVDYRCNFVLKNLTAKPLKIQVGFSAGRDFDRRGKHLQLPPTLYSTTALLPAMTQTTYHVRYVSNDSEKKFSRLFLWDMAFDRRRNESSACRLSTWNVPSLIQHPQGFRHARPPLA